MTEQVVTEFNPSDMHFFSNCLNKDRECKMCRWRVNCARIAFKFYGLPKEDRERKLDNSGV